MTKIRYSSQVSNAAVGNLLICFSHLRWHFVYQRPQHLLSRAAKMQPVYFIEEPIFEDNCRERLDIVTTPEGVMVAVPVLEHGQSHDDIIAAQRRLIDELLSTMADVPLTTWYYTPMAIEFSRHLNPRICVYDNMDELSGFRGAPAPLLALEQELLARADIVFTGGESLYEAKQGRHENLHCFPSSIDAQHFGKARLQSTREAADQATLPGPRVGYFAVIDERLDIDLVAKVADLRPDWQFVIIGPVVKIDPKSLPQRPNLHWMGARSYSELPSYLSGWDVAFMPFARNEATRYISPTKTPEFLAAGVPVVSTPINDVIRPYGQMGLVEIASSPEELVARAEILMGHDRASWLARVDEHLAKNSWDKTWKRMSEVIARTTAKSASVRDVSGSRVKAKRASVGEAALSYIG
jgi:glycosyltransferase involved in cell wall biosynthesis